MSHLILINDPAVILVTPSLMALLVLDHLVDRKVTKASPFRQTLAVSRLSDTGRPRDDNIW